ncbi:response regulator [Nitrospinota bacterium]
MKYFNNTNDRISGLLMFCRGQILKSPDIPENETERLEALDSYEVLDTPPESPFDDLTKLAAHILDVPISLVSLIDTDRQWFKSRYGLEAPETPRDLSFCGHVVADGRSLVVPDSRRDVRFSDNPLVTGDPQVIFYAGAPLITAEGYVLGTLCAIDNHPRSLPPEKMKLLNALARQVMSQLELRRQLIDQKKMEERIRNSEEKYRAVLDTAADGIISIDNRGTVEALNQTARKMFGFQEEEVIGQNVKMLMPAPFHGEHDGYIRNYLDTGEKKIIGIGREVVGLRKDGTTFPMELAVSEVRQGERIIFTGIIRDITERHEIERMKNEFVSVVSHEIRTPLTSLRGSLGLLAGGMAGELSPEGKELLDIAVNNSDRLIRLINDILDLEKIESGKMDLEISPSPVEDLVTRAVAEMQGSATEKGISIENEVEPAEALADGDTIVQVLTNLLSNAIKFSESGGRVTVKAGRIGDCVEVSVVDRGRGIPPDAIKSIFDRFEQVDSSDSRDKGGTGLGLAICKAIIEQHGGQIRVESEWGKGSTFIFSLPVMTPVSNRIHASPPQPSQNRFPVLICDDDPDFVRLMELLMEKEGYSTVATYSGEEALDYLRENKVSAVILDIVLPKMSGLEVLNEIKRRGDTENYPIVIVSGKEPSLTPEGFGPFVIDWIKKPFNEDRLLRVLKDSIQHDRDATVLIVDDDRDMLTVFSELLGRRGLIVETASSGRQAVDICHRKLPDLIILDIVMPDGDGFFVIDALRRDLKMRHIPVVIYSAKEPTPEEKQRLAIGTTVFMTKSKTSQEEFESKVLELLKGYSADLSNQG